MRNKIIQGDSLEVLKTLEDESVDMVITSPPYWALRDYGTASWEGGDEKCDHKKNPEPLSEEALAKSTIGKASSTGHALEGYKDICGKCGAKRIDKQLGLEPTFEEYIDKLCDIFDEVKRVLKKEGTCWVNLGDTYFGSGKGAGGDGSSKESFTFEEKEKRICQHCGKEFTGWKFQNYCGSACSGVDNTPRTKKGKLPDKTLCQIPSRFAIEMTNRGWILRNEIIWHKPNAMPSSVKDRFTVDFEKLFFFTKSKKYYFETQYEAYTGPMNRWGGDKLEAKGESSWDKGTGQESYRDRDLRPNEQGRNKRTVWKIPTKPYPEAHFAVYPQELIETPIKAGCPEGGIVLDPFMGSGTTAFVARELGRDYLGIELNPEYIPLIEDRLKQNKLL